MELILKIDKKRIDKCYWQAFDQAKGGEDISSDLPSELVSNLNAWKYGKYGWTSPVNLMLTAMVVKWFNPDQDVCKIWARNNTIGSIPGSYSIRSYDEKYIVPFVNKFMIDSGFCSPNSGMQGSRALEKNKLRESGARIDRDSELGQRVLFDIELFKSILNDVDELSSEEARSAFVFLVQIAIDIKNKREAEAAKLGDVKGVGSEVIRHKLLDKVNEFKDPQFVKVVTGSVLAFVMNDSTSKSEDIHGFHESKTSADARSKMPGDLWTQDDEGDALVACEVKDQTKMATFDILASIARRMENHSSLKSYLIVTAANEVASCEDLEDPQWRALIEKYESEGLTVLIFTLQQLFDFYYLRGNECSDLLNAITSNMKKTPNLKKSTMKRWRKFLEAESV